MAGYVNGDLFFDAEAYWRDKLFKKWVVYLSKGSGKKPDTRIMYIGASTEEKAIACAKRHCVLTGRVHGRARLATPTDLGCTTTVFDLSRSDEGVVMKVLDLFSGIGGFSLGLHRAGMATVAFCEIEPFPQAVLRKNFPGVPIYDDVRTITADRLRTDGIDTVDLICGGFPCQPFSAAGNQLGAEDHRHLWPEMLRVVQEVRPTWVIGENVAGFIEMALDDVCLDLEAAGYEVQPFVIPACAVDAPHRRDRVWIIANRQSRGLSELRRSSGGAGLFDRVHEDVPDLSCLRRERKFGKDTWGRAAQDESSTGGQDDTNSPGHSSGYGNHDDVQEERDVKESGEFGSAIRSGQCWHVEPDVGRVADGVPSRVDRLKGLGNSVVPQIPEILGRAIVACSWPS